MEVWESHQGRGAVGVRPWLGSCVHPFSVSEAWKAESRKGEEVVTSGGQKAKGLSRKLVFPEGSSCIAESFPSLFISKWRKLDQEVPPGFPPALRCPSPQAPSCAWLSAAFSKVPRLWGMPCSLTLLKEGAINDPQKVRGAVRVGVGRSHTLYSGWRGRRHFLPRPLHSFVTASLPPTALVFLPFFFCWYFFSWFPAISPVVVYV